MTAIAGAPSHKNIHWKAILWPKVEQHVRRLQLRIAKAIKIGRYAKAKALQWILSHSFYAKLLAVKRVTQNDGKRTPGIDGIIWKTDAQKIKAAYSLKRRGYKSQPLRRIYIPKKNGKLRPLSVPTMPDRAQQALHLLGLMPVTEIRADENSYGFRPKRSTHDAIQQCFIALAKTKSASWILEGDIKACFDKISHNWILNNIIMDKTVLKQWLEAGYIEKDTLKNTTEGTPQGGLASPTIANQTLDGMEALVKKIADKGDKINFVRYADDFICTASSKEILETKVKPILIQFLKERGLELSMEKTKITHIDEGFDFLGFNIRKYNNKLLIKPSKTSIKKFTDSLKEIIQKMGNKSTSGLIAILNSKIRGWTNYYRSCVAKAIFSDIDNTVYNSLWKMLKAKHKNKSISWIRNKYFTRIGPRSQCFFTKARTKKGETKIYTLIHASRTTIRRHIKIRGKATPFDPEYESYFTQRENRSKLERINNRIVNNNFKEA